MKIHFDNVNLDAKTGPNTFANRLARSLFELGHEVIFNSGSNSDISLVFIEPSGVPLSRKVVQRLDGIWFKPEQFISHNVNIKMTYERANAVIFQSQFDKNMISHHWGEPACESRIIRNGFDLQNQIKTHLYANLAELRAKYDNFFVCSSNWHPQKRLSSNIALFEYARKNLPGKSCLVIVGSNPEKMVADFDIFYTDSVAERMYLELYSCADWFLHLAWLDHCPNVVCEALSQNTPVICSSSGGTSELVKDFGIVLNETSQYNYELVDYDNPPAIDVEQIDLRKLIEKPTGNHAVLDIRQTAKQYVELFERLI